MKDTLKMVSKGLKTEIELFLLETLQTSLKKTSPVNQTLKVAICKIWFKNLELIGEGLLKLILMSFQTNSLKLEELRRSEQANTTDQVVKTIMITIIVSQVPQIHWCQAIVQLKQKMQLVEETMINHFFQSDIKSHEIITIICLKKWWWLVICAIYSLKTFSTSKIWLLIGNQMSEWLINAHLAMLLEI